jgi:hypothetical protein
MRILQETLGRNTHYCRTGIPMFATLSSLQEEEGIQDNGRMLTRSWRRQNSHSQQSIWGTLERTHVQDQIWCSQEASQEY